MTPDQIEKLWIAEQQLKNPLYTFMTDTEKSKNLKDIQAQYLQLSSFLVPLYSDNTVLTPVDTDIKDDSEDAPFGDPTSHSLAGHNVQLDPNDVALYDNDQIIYYNTKTKIIDEIWLLDGSSSVTGHITSDFVYGTQHEGTNNPDEIAELLYPGQYLIKHLDFSHEHWHDVHYPYLNIFNIVRNDSGVWHSLGRISSQYESIPAQLDAHLYDPLHPETINPEWSLESARHLESNNVQRTMRNQGGPILANCELFVIFWGSSWQTNPYANDLLQFYTDLFVSDYMNVLKQYGINSGTVIGYITVTNVPPVISDEWAHGVISNMISSGVIPTPNANTFYMGQLDSGISIGGARQLSFSDRGAAGYHDHFITPSLHTCRYGFSSYSTNLELLTIIGCHEVTEAMTDPDYTAWTPDHGYTELSDLCEQANIGTIQVGGNIWEIAPVFDSSTQTCKISSPTPITDPYIPIAGELNQFVWRIPEFEAINNTFRMTVTRDLNTNHYGWYGTITNALTQDQWYAKYIQPLKGNPTIIPVTNQQTTGPTTPQELEIQVNNDNNKRASLISSTDTLILYKINYTNGLVQYELFYFYPKYPTVQNEWQLIGTFSIPPDNVQIAESILTRPRTIIKNHRKATLGPSNQILLLNNDGNVIGDLAQDPYDPNAFNPGEYLVENINDKVVKWVTKSAPWQQILNIKRTTWDQFQNFGNESGAVLFGFRDILDDDCYHPERIDSRWSIIDFDGVDIYTWDIGHPNYSIKVQIVHYVRYAQESGIYLYDAKKLVPLSFTHRDIDGTIKEVLIPERPYNIITYITTYFDNCESILMIPVNSQRMVATGGPIFSTKDQLKEYYSFLDVVSETATTLTFTMRDSQLDIVVEYFWEFDPNMRTPIQSVSDGEPIWGYVMGGYLMKYILFP